MKKSFLPLLVLLSAGGLSTAFSQAAIPEPELPNVDQPVVLTGADPLASLEEQLNSGPFDRRGAFATAFDEAERTVDARLSEMRARGLVFADEAESNLTLARDGSRQAFRDLSLTTNETWQSARHNAVLALRKLRGSLGALERTATGRP